MTSAPVRFALVGAGFIGSVIADTLARVDGADLRLVVARSERSARPVAAAHGARWSTDMKGYLERSDDVDVVIVATPSGTHADIAVPALRAGKHVLIEKPLDITLEAADRIIAAERASGNMVGVVSQHRFDRSSKRVLDACARGGLGRLTSARASCAWWRGQSYYDSSEWRGTWLGDGGGATMNQAIHIIDLMVAAMGAPVEVFGWTATLAHERIEVEDTAVAVVRFASGALGTIHATTAAYPGMGLLLAIHGDGGSAAILDEELSFLHATDGAPPPIEMSDSGAAYNQVGPGDRLDPEDRNLGLAHADQLRDLSPS